MADGSRLVFQGQWYTGVDSTRCAVNVFVETHGRVLIQDADSEKWLAGEEGNKLTVSSRLGNSARYITFPNGGMLETLDNEAVDQMQRRCGPSLVGGLLYRLESSFKWVLLAVLVTLGVGWAGVYYGIPASARFMAERLPAQTLDLVAREVLIVLDRTRFSPSTLTTEQQAELQHAFADVLARFPELRLRVLFRSGGEKMGANAFALPDGTIIFTDEMIQLAKSHEELIAVLAHEIGHVVERHSLRAVIQSAFLGIGYVLLVGDASAVADLLVGMPVVLATLSYSRNHEREADAFSARMLDDMGIERGAFVELMRRLGHSHQCAALLASGDDEQLTDDERLQQCSELQQKASEPSGRQSGWQDYLSTHPDMHERLRDFMERY